MNNFLNRYNNLNAEQKQAVDQIDGPLLVVAGPGTGKTELLSLRVANILQKTDTLPSSILCLTFTDSGANAMRSRLSEIIGPDAYKVSINTFHSFGTEIINQNKEYFYNGADFSPANDIATHEILTVIFDSLEHDNPLSSSINGEYVYINEVLTSIGELKKAGLTSRELVNIISENEKLLDAVEPELTEIFSNTISTSLLTTLVPVAKKVASYKLPSLPVGITPLANTLALSMARAFDLAVETNKTTYITAWRNEWMEYNTFKKYVFKDRKRYKKLRALADIYTVYLSRLSEAKIYDYNDMVLNVVHALENNPDLKATLQEKYQYILVDEFQDTNLAQIRILFNLTDTELNDSPNIMAVGDDDQAIFGFQGADVNNIHRFKSQYPNFNSVVLVNNYRSSQNILDVSRQIITQSDDRLETAMNINKTLVAKNNSPKSDLKFISLPTPTDELFWISESIHQQLAKGTPANDIAVIAKKHSDLEEIANFLQNNNIEVNYERRDDVLELPIVKIIELVARISIAIFNGEHIKADSLLPEMLAHPAFNVDAETLWKLSLRASKNRATWIETMLQSNDLKDVAEWLINRAKAVPNESLEQFIDEIIGIQNIKTLETTYVPPISMYFFGTDTINSNPKEFIIALEAVRTLREALQEYNPNKYLDILDLIIFIDLNKSLGNKLLSVRTASEYANKSVNLMTAHKSKGLEFDTVYIYNSVDSRWGERARGKSALITYPANLLIRISSNTYAERLRLFFVATTRAKRHLFVTFSTLDNKGKNLLPASFLTGVDLPITPITPNYTPNQIKQINLSTWYKHLIQPVTTSLKEILTPNLEIYKLSATHLNNFIDIVNAGPEIFLLNNLLRFPQAKSANANYGTAIHSALQRAHNHLRATGEKRPVEDLLGDFIQELERCYLTDQEFSKFSKRGTKSLSAFFKKYYNSFNINQKTELSFSNQGVLVGKARLTGSLDLIEVNDNNIVVTDYKTGSASVSWTGKSDFEKIKLHKYRQQLMFYQLLCKNSRDYAKYDFIGAVLQYVEPDETGEIHQLTDTFSKDDLERFTKLIGAVWHCIMNLELPDTSTYPQSLKGIKDFENDLIDKFYKR